MAKIINTRKGFKIIRTSLFEITAAEAGAMGICDSCNKSDFVGYYIPVLSRWYCRKCAKDWLRRAVYYPEDAEFENFKFNEMVSKLKMFNLL